MASKINRVLSACVLLLVGLAMWEAWRLARLRSWNAEIEAGRVGAVHARDPAELRFAAAFALGRQGDTQAALSAYQELETAEDVRLRHDARFNSANLYLQQALAENAKAGAGATLALIELAKQSYRELLREDSDEWDARYNLEWALRIAPDAQQDELDLPPPPDHRRTPSNAQGATLTLP